MSGDEILALIAAAIGCLFFWGPWFFACLTVATFSRARSLRFLGLAVPSLAVASLYFLLRNYASHDVRDDGVYLLFYTIMGAAWLGIAPKFSGLFGLGFRDDWLERRNPAAASAGAGVLVGTIAAFGGANIGDGPGWWVVVFCALLSTAALLVCWWLLAKFSGCMERITLDRDLATGLRFGSFLAAVGIIAGRMVAGDWHSAGATIDDFVRSAWPLLPYTIVVAGFERRFARLRLSGSTFSTAGWIIFHAGAVMLYLHWVGPWE